MVKHSNRKKPIRGGVGSKSKDREEVLLINEIDNERNNDYITAVGNNEDNKVLLLYVPFGQKIKFDPGTLIYYQNINIDTNFQYQEKGGFFGLLAGMFTSQFTGEEFYHNVATGTNSTKNGILAISQTFPGNIVELDVSGKDGLILNYGSFLACTSNVDIIARNNFRFSELFNIGSQETLIFPKAARIPSTVGPHKVWAQGFGDIQKVVLEEGETLNVDNERFFACDDDGSDLYTVKPSGGLKSFFFSQIGFVMEFRGPRTVYVQSKGIMTYLSELRSKLNIKD